MDIYIYKNGQQQGPFNERTIQNGLNSGEFAYSDLAWHQGMTDWQPLSQILPALSAPPVSSVDAPPSSGLAKTSFIMAMATAAVWLFLNVLYVMTHRFRNVHEITGLIIFLFVASILVNITGIVFGIIGSAKNISNKWMAIIGMVVNTLGLISMSFLFI